MELDRRRLALSLVLSVLVFTASSGLCAVAAADESGTAAGSPDVGDQRGVEFADGRVWASAFATLAFESLDGQPEEINVDDLALLARWQATDRLSFFGSVAVEDFVDWLDGEKVEVAHHRPHV